MVFRTHAIAICFLVVHCFCVSMLWSDEPSTTYHGKVLFLDRPVENVKVRGKHFIKGRGPESVATKTGADGTFEISLQGNQHFAPLLFETSDGTLFSYATLTRDSSNDSLEKQRIALPDVVLAPPKVIRVLVVDANQRPVPDANVYLQAYYAAACQVKTNDDGVAVLRYPAGLTNQTVGAMKPKAGIDYRSFEVLDQKTHPENLEQGFEGEVKLCLNGVKNVSIEILDPSGKPLPGIAFRPWLMKKPNHGDHWNLAGYPEFFRTSDENGVAHFDMLAIDQKIGVDFWSKLDREDWFVVGNGLDHDDERATIKWNEADNVTVHVKEMMQIGGRVIHADGRPAKDVRVSAHGSFHYASWFNAESKTDADGNWKTWVKPDGYYLVLVKDDQFAATAYDGVCFLEGEKPATLDFVLEPARRIHGRVDGLEETSSAYVMLQQAAKEYHSLPNRPLPNPKNSNRSINAFSQVSIPLQKDGTFEFKVGPGDFIIWDTDRKTQKFTLGPGDLVKKFEFGSVKTTIPITIKVYSAESDEPIANASVICKSEDFFGNDLRATTNASGEIKSKRASGTMHALSICKERSLGGYAILPSEDLELEIALWPLATIRGTLVDKTKTPIANAELRFGIELKYKDGTTSNIATNLAKTNEDGVFELEGVVQGIVHKLYRIQKQEGLESYEWVSDILTTETESDLGSIKMK